MRLVQSTAATMALLAMFLVFDAQRIPGMVTTDVAVAPARTTGPASPTWTIYAAGGAGELMRF